MNRNLTWNACLNVRDLGGLKTRRGDRTKYRGLIRADEIDRLDPSGVAALKAYGIKTVIDLRDASERHDLDEIDKEITRLHIPLEDHSDRVFWDEWREYNCTPLYYKAFLERSPNRIARVFAAIAGAPEGGLVFHCSRGRDRTGLVSILLLELAETDREEIVSDYELSADNLKSLTAVKEAEKIHEVLHRHRTTPHVLIHGLLQEIDVEQYLLQHGLGPQQIGRIRAKLA